MRVLITGAGGFSGQHLVDHMVNAGHEVWGTVHPTIADKRHLPDSVKTFVLDLTDYDSVLAAIEEARPEWIVHLGSVSFLPESFIHVLDAWRTNLFGTLHLYEATRNASINTRIMFGSSAAVYGPVTEDKIPLVETMPLNPAEPYGASKAAGELASMQYVQSFGLPIVCARSFNHTGPGQPPIFVCSEFARSIALAEAGKTPPVIRVGNLESRRDIVDVRDVVCAYAALVEYGVSGQVYNVAGGRDIAISKILETLLGMTKMRINVEVAKEKIRPVELPVVVGDPTKIRKAIGWEPKIPLKQTLSDILTWWRERIARGEDT